MRWLARARGSKRESRERLERDGAMADGLTSTNKLARARARRSKREMKLSLMA